MKMFRTNNIEIVRNCQSYLGFNLPSDLWPNRVKMFDIKYATSRGSFVKYGFIVWLLPSLFMFAAFLVLIVIVFFFCFCAISSSDE